MTQPPVKHGPTSTDAALAPGIRSMSGYGVGRVNTLDGTLVVELRAVNHRYFEVRSRLPGESQRLHHRIEGLMRKALLRGRVAISLTFERSTDSESGCRLNRARAKRWMEELRTLRDEVAPQDPLPWMCLVAAPGLFGEVKRDSPSDETLVEEAAQIACGELDTMRRNEGVALKRDLGDRLNSCQQHAEALGHISSECIPEIQRRMEQRVAALLSATGGEPVALDPARIAQEVAHWVDRSDVSEELVRLSSHINQARQLLECPDQPVGRRLDFLAQEMAREANTLGSKAPDASFSPVVIDLKSEIERFREQVQNVL